MARTRVRSDDDVLTSIDEVVDQRGRSRLLQEAALEKLERLALERVLRQTAGMVKGHADWADRPATERWSEASVRACQAPERVSPRRGRPVVVAYGNVRTPRCVT